MARLSIYGTDAEYRTSTLDLGTIGFPISVDASLTNASFAQSSDGSVFTCNTGGIMSKRVGDDAPTTLTTISTLQEFTSDNTYLWGAAGGVPGTLVRVEKSSFTSYDSYTVTNHGVDGGLSQSHCAIDGNGDVWLPTGRVSGTLSLRFARLTKFDTQALTFGPTYDITSVRATTEALSIVNDTAYASVDIVNSANKQVLQVDLTDGSIDGSITIAGVPRHSVILNGDLFVVTSSNFYKIDLATFTTTTSLAISSTYAIATDGSNDLWLADGGTLRRVDASTFTVIATATITPGTDGNLIAFEPDVATRGWVVGSVGW